MMTWKIRYTDKARRDLRNIMEYVSYDLLEPETAKNLLKRIEAGTATQVELKNSFVTLTRAMAAHYGKPVILLLDEYDVPIAKASAKGYYAEMLDVVKGLMQALKDNDALRFAVVTGCLRIAKESIFTGTNNFVSDTISSSHLNEYFGFRWRSRR